MKSLLVILLYIVFSPIVLAGILACMSYVAFIVGWELARSLKDEL